MADVVPNIERLRESFGKKFPRRGPGAGAGHRKSDKIDPKLELPPVGNTEGAIREYLAAVAEAVGKGRLDQRVADTCISAAKASLAALKQANAKGEIKRLQQMLKQAQGLQRAGAQHEAADRLGQAGEEEDVELNDGGGDEDED